MGDPGVLESFARLLLDNDDGKTSSFGGHVFAPFSFTIPGV